jgi:hypothetical protein
MPTNPNMVAIQTVTVGSGGAASIEFTNIPQTYTDLVVLISARSVRSAFIDYIRFDVNNNTGSIYNTKMLTGYGSTAASGADGPSSYLWSGTVPAANATTSTFGNIQIYFTNYTGSTNKSISIDSVLENNSATDNQLDLVAGLASTTSAITSIKLYNQISNFAQYTTATLYGVTSSAYGAKATGGIITSDANYFYHTFLASGTFTPTANLTADYLVVAGGGGGGTDRGAGGGAGGLRSTVTNTGGGGSLESAVSLTNGTAYTVTVGAGAASGTVVGGAARGSNSSISGSGLTTITSTGGGGGVSADGNQGNQSGGSGGGGAGSGFTAGGAGTANQGYAGGNGVYSPPNYGGGGGGGAGAVGGNGTTTTGGAGGNGVAVAISGSSVTYAGGGGAGTYGGGTGGAGGSGGGGAGRNGGTGQVGGAGTANTGGGGGGGSGNPAAAGGAGGSGIVIVRYAK